MNSLEITLIVLLEVIVIDLAMRFNLHPAATSSRNKPAGIISLFILSLSQKQKNCTRKLQTLQRYFLSIFTVFFLIISQYFILTAEALKTDSVIVFSLTLIPVFIGPFYHFLYDMIDTESLSIRNVLFNFRLRGAAALVLSANIVFIYLNSVHHVFSMAGHLFFSWSAILSLFSLCAQHRKNPSSDCDHLKTQNEFLDTEILRYLASILEVFYCTTLLYFVFIHGPLEAWLQEKPSFFILFGIFNLLLVATAALAKTVFKQEPTSLPEFYESKILPLSFILFGFTSIARYYF
jgi:hypothetical protein